MPKEEEDMPGHASEERDGALLRRLKEVGSGSRAGRLGFMAGADGSRRRALVLVARLMQSPGLAGEMRALVAAGVDAVEIVPRAGGAELAATIAAAGVPCGLLITPDAARNDAGLLEIDGLDWIHVGLSAPARYLAAEGVTRLIEVAPDMPPGRLSGLAGLKAEAIVVEAPAGGGDFTVDALTAICAIQAATKRPALAIGGSGLAPRDAAVLREHSVEGVLVTGGMEAVRAWSRAIEELK